jgi:DNA-binding transcriptional regulator YbjK
LLGENQFSGGSSNEGTEENPLQDLFESYVSDLYKLREAFHDQLASSAKELSQAMVEYTRRSEAVLTSFMENVAARGVELEAEAAVRLDQFRGLPATGGLPNVNDGPPARTPPVEDKIAAAAERAVADVLHVENDETHKPWSGRAIALVRSEPAA